MAADFQTIGLPWLNSFSQLSDIARYFYEHKIADLPGATPRRHHPFSWAIYGWILTEQGDVASGKQWIQKARTELSKPLFRKGGRVFAEPIDGGRISPRLPEEMALLRILESDEQR